MAKIQFSLIIKIKIGRPEHLLTHNPPPRSSKWTTYVYHPISAYSARIGKKNKYQQKYVARQFSHYK